MDASAFDVVSLYVYVNESAGQRNVTVARRIDPSGSGGGVCVCPWSWRMEERESSRLHTQKTHQAKGRQSEGKSKLESTG